MLFISRPFVVEAKERAILEWIAGPGRASRAKFAFEETLVRRLPPDANIAVTRQREFCEIFTLQHVHPSLPVIVDMIEGVQVIRDDLALRILLRVIAKVRKIEIGVC